MIDILGLEGYCKTSMMRTQWFQGSFANGSEERNRPISTSNGWTELSMAFRVTGRPSDCRVASNTVSSYLK